MKHLQHSLAYLFLFFLTCLFASYYILAKATLARIDPLLFTGGSLLSLLPAATILGLINRRQLNWRAWRAGCLLGLNLAGILLALPIVLQMTGSATETAFFPCLSGVCALVIERYKNREAVLRWWAWAAGGVTMGGMLVVLTATHATALHWGGDVLAFSTGTIGQTAYLFLVEDV
ncbi:MAG TPA: EamA family transporter, partial [Ktedonobacteraceae bacterium]